MPTGYKKNAPFKKYRAPVKMSKVPTQVSDSESDDSEPAPKMLKKSGPKLVIVESPSKCKKIESFLGSGYKCIASFGHFREIASPDNIKINADTGTLDIKYTNMKTASMRKAISTMKSEAEKASEVIIATDDDREGEAIGWHICSLLK